MTDYFNIAVDTEVEKQIQERLEEQRAQFEEERAHFKEERDLLGLGLEEVNAQLNDENERLRATCGKLVRRIQGLRAPRKNKKWTEEEEKILLEKYEELGANIRSKKEEKMHNAIARYIDKTPTQIHSKIYQDAKRNCWFGEQLRSIDEKVRTKMFMKMREDN